MRLAIDATSLIGARTGIGTVTAELLERLPRPGLEITAFAVTHRGVSALGPYLGDGIRRARGPMAARPLRLAWRLTGHPVIERWTGSVDVVHGPNFVVPPSRSAARVATVHDLTFHHFPEMCTPDTLKVPALLRRAVAEGVWIHTVSAAVATEVIEVFGADPDRVVTVPNGAPDPHEPSEVESARQRGRAMVGSDEYMLALGTIEPRKDLPSLVAAFDRLAGRMPSLRLVIAGPDGWGVDELNAALDRCRHRERVIRTGFVDPELRTDLLAGARVFAYPSRYEGFGLPPLEALACGTPVVATRTGALPEVLDDAAEWASPGDVDSLVEALDRVLVDEARAEAIVAAGRARLANYSWESTAAAMVQLYERAMRDR